MKSQKKEPLDFELYNLAHIYPNRVKALYAPLCNFQGSPVDPSRLFFLAGEEGISISPSAWSHSTVISIRWSGQGNRPSRIVPKRGA